MVVDVVLNGEGQPICCELWPGKGSVDLDGNTTTLANNATDRGKQFVDLNAEGRLIRGPISGQGANGTLARD